jgi:hypothetical protein
MTLKARSHRVSKRSGTHSLTIPAAIGRSLPEICEWQIEVTKSGLLLLFVGEVERLQNEGKRSTVELPFVK